MGQRVKKIFRILENRKKRLRAFVERLYDTNVLYKCIIQTYDTNVWISSFFLFLTFWAN